ncbi:cysteine hydrolase family protein [Pseudomonas sp. App30]|uniref:cysteine hydrolase family protein n=1 Tax=Pseudomonas sp. App30 TaxID=3068990 RepID=UPI003A80E052
MAALKLNRPALLIVDVQVGLIHGPQKPWQGERLLATINQVIAQAQAAGAPILAVRHTGPAGSPIAQGSPFWQVAPELNLAHGNVRLFDKQASSAFQGTDLEQWLKAEQVEDLVIVGLKTQYCVDSACRAAAQLGFKPVLVADGHSCMDTDLLAAEMIIAHHNQTLHGPIARVAAAAELQF